MNMLLVIRLLLNRSGLHIEREECIIERETPKAYIASIKGSGNRGKHRIQIRDIGQIIAPCQDTPKTIIRHVTCKPEDEQAFLLQMRTSAVSVLKEMNAQVDALLKNLPA